jgi:hypothetical protein
MAVFPVVNIDTDDPRVVALALAVMHHGLSNLAERSIPPKPETVIATAMDFERHLKNERPVARQQSSRR